MNHISINEKWAKTCKTYEQFLLGLPNGKDTPENQALFTHYTGILLTAKDIAVTDAALVFDEQETKKNEKIIGEGEE